LRFRASPLIVSRWVLSAALAAWAIPVIGFFCAQFVRRTYKFGEYINPGDVIETNAAVAGWCVACLALVATLLLRRKTDRRYALWSLALSAIYALTPLIIALDFLVHVMLGHIMRDGL
jgi:hypothetical protein